MHYVHIFVFACSHHHYFILWNDLEKSQIVWKMIGFVPTSGVLEMPDNLGEQIALKMIAQNSYG